VCEQNLAGIRADHENTLMFDVPPPFLFSEGMMVPLDFNFIPSTLGEDGDPFDILVLMDAPAHVGCLLEAASARNLQSGLKSSSMQWPKG
jgi:inorganic pyrophosphatase